MKSNNSEKLLLISRYNLDLVRQIINNQNLINKKVYCDFFNGNLEIFLMKVTSLKVSFSHSSHFTAVEFLRISTFNLSCILSFIYLFIIVI